jgi:hypothetical protein
MLNGSPVRGAFRSSFIIHHSSFALTSAVFVHHSSFSIQHSAFSVEFPMPLVPPILLRVRRRRRPTRGGGRHFPSPPPPPPPPPPAVTLTAVHTQPGGSELMFVFDDDVVSIDGVAAEQFECTLEGNPPQPGDSIVEFDGAHILIAFSQDVSSAMTGTLVSGEGIVFDGGGVAVGGQTVAATPP